MNWKRRSWSVAAVLLPLAALVAVALALHLRDRPGLPSARRNARQAFLAEITGVRDRAIRDASASAAGGRFGFHTGSFAEAQMEGRFPGLENCRIPGALTVTDLTGTDDRKEALRSVYGEAYNLEIARIRPGAVLDNCAPPRRGERPARVLEEHETRFAGLSRLQTPPAYVDYYICSAERSAGPGAIHVSLTVGPEGGDGPIHAEWSSPDPLSRDQVPRFDAVWNAESDAGDWIAAGSVSLYWEIFPPLGPAGSKMSVAFRDPAGRAVPLRLRNGNFSERHAEIFADWSELRRAVGPNGVDALLVAPGGRQALSSFISAGTLDQVERRLREAAAQVAADAGDPRRRCQHITGS